MTCAPGIVIVHKVMLGNGMRYHGRALSGCTKRDVGDALSPVNGGRFSLWKPHCDFTDFIYIAYNP